MDRQHIFMKDEEKIFTLDNFSLSSLDDDINSSLFALRDDRVYYCFTLHTIFGLFYKMRSIHSILCTLYETVLGKDVNASS